MVIFNSVSFYISDGNKVRKLKRRHLVSSSLNTVDIGEIYRSFYTVYPMAYHNVYSILPWYFSGTHSTKMDEDVVDWRSLIEMMISFQMKTLDPFKNLFSFFQFLTFCVIWTSHKATKGWHVTFEARRVSDALHLVMNFIIFIICLFCSCRHS